MSRSTSDNSIHQKRPRGKVLTTGHSICSSLPSKQARGAMAHGTPCAHLYGYNDDSEQQKATDNDRSVHEVCKRSCYVNRCQTGTHCRHRAASRTSFLSRSSMFATTQHNSLGRAGRVLLRRVSTSRS